VRDLFLALADTDPDRYLVVDGELPPEQIHEHIRTRVATVQGVAR
jgi:thymidylate kinase